MRVIQSNVLVSNAVVSPSPSGDEELEDSTRAEIAGAVDKKQCSID